jgi:hypothetical protein
MERRRFRRRPAGAGAGSGEAKHGDVAVPARQGNRASVIVPGMSVAPSIRPRGATLTSLSKTGVAPGR